MDTAKAVTDQAISVCPGPTGEVAFSCDQQARHCGHSRYWTPCTLHWMAEAREYQLKKLPRTEKLKLVSQVNSV